MRMPARLSTRADPLAISLTHGHAVVRNGFASQEWFMAGAWCPLSPAIAGHRTRLRCSRLRAWGRVVAAARVAKILCGGNSLRGTGERDENRETFEK